MNQIFRYCVAGALLALSSLAVPQRLVGQSVPEPAVIISIAEIDKQLGMIDHLVNAAGFPEFKFLAQNAVKQYTKGIDTKKPACVMLTFSEDSEVPEFLACIPVKNMEELLDVVAQFAEVDEDGDDVTLTMPDGTELMVKQVNGMAYIARDEAMLKSIPSNPEKLMEDMPKKFNLAAKVYGKRIPQSVREGWLETIREGYEAQMEMMGEDSLQADLQEMNWKQMESGLNEMESVLIGMNVDKESKNLTFDFEMRAETNSELAKKLNAGNLKDGSQFKGFLMNGAAMNAHYFMGTSPQDVEQFQKMIEKIPAMVKEQLEDEELEEKEIAVLEKAARDLAKILSDTMAQGKMDGGAVMIVDDQEVNFAAGMNVANPKEMEGVIKDLVPMIQEKLGSELKVELNSGNYKDVTFHRFTVDIPDDEEEAIKMMGEQVNLIIGIGQKAVYFGAGSNPTDLLKNAMDGANNSEKLGAMEMNFFIGQFLKLGAKASDDPIVKKMAKKLASVGNDRVRISMEYIENGYKGRAEVQDGILSLIKVAANQFSGGMDEEDDEEMEDDDF